MTTYMITGAAGQLGQLAIAALAARVAKENIVALVRKEADRAAYETQGIAARIGDYEDLAGLQRIFTGIDRLLLISSNALGQRTAQHKNVITAAKAAGVEFVAYTSLLQADVSPMILATEHKETEVFLAASGLSYAVLRNGWYTENLLMSLQTDLKLGQHFGAAGAGRLSTAPRRDYAEAAAIVLSGGDHHGKIYELGGDSAFTLADYARTLSAATGQDISYTDLPQQAFSAALQQAGLPVDLAEMLADSDAKSSYGWLETGSTDLAQLIGRPTETLAATLQSAVNS